MSQVPNVEFESANGNNEVIYCLLLSDASDSWGQFLVEDQTATLNIAGGDRASLLKFVGEAFKESNLSATTLRNFTYENENPAMLNSLSKCTAHAKIVEKETLSQLLEARNGWASLKEKFPYVRSVVRFSKIGLSDQGDQGLVYMSFQTGPKSGSGDYYLLGKQGNVWKVMKRVNVWKS